MANALTLPSEAATPSPLADAPMPLSARLTQTAVIAYVAATWLGVMMRLEMIGVGTGVPFDHLLHAHSHTLYFGWVALGLLVAALSGMSRVTSPLRWAATVLIAMTPLLFLGFLATGYHPATIVVSTVVMMAWYVVAVCWWRQLPNFEKEAALAYRYGLGYLVASSIGIWTLAAVQATGGTPLAEQLAVHAFLIGFGWFFIFAVVGAVLSAKGRLGLALDPGRMRSILHWWAAAAWATFPLGVVGGPEAAGLGPVSRVAGMVLLIPGTMFVVQLWSAASAARMRLLMRLAAGWFAVGAATTAAAAFGGSAALLAGGRQGIVIHLHAVFVGFVTPLLVLALSRRSAGVLLFHHGALGVMLGALVVVILGQPNLGMNVAALAAVLLWVAGIGWAWPIARDSVRPRTRRRSVQ